MDTPPLESSLRTETLFEALRARILSGALRPGERLPAERALADSFGTNRNTLREAIRRLEAHGLVSVRQGSGATVLDFRRTAGLEVLGAFLTHGADPVEKARALLDLLEPRIRVIEFLVEQVVERASDTDVATLEEAASALRAAERTRDRQAFMVAQVGWLAAMAHAAHNLPLRWIANPLLKALEDVTRRWPQLTVFEPSYAAYAGQVLEAISVRDVDRGRRVTRAFHEQVDATLRRQLATALPGSHDEEPSP